eukprot:g20733.t1
MLYSQWKDPIAAVLDSNNVLKKIDLSDNRFGSRGAQQLASGVSRNKSLIELNLSRNSIGDQGAEEFLAVLDVAVRPRPAALRILDLSGNSITRHLTLITASLRASQLSAPSRVLKFAQEDLGPEPKSVGNKIKVMWRLF